jgi:small conductance mechanosensitive channel
MNVLLENLIEVLQTWWDGFLDNLPSLLTGLLIFLVSLYLARLISRSVGQLMNRRKDDMELTILIIRLVRWIVIGMGILLALEQAGQDVTALLTGLGIIGFTVGFALQDVSANLVSGILLLFEQPFEIGDIIEVKGYAGTVRTIHLRATEMQTLEGLRVLIPNREVFTNTIINYTRIEQRRIGLQVGVGYECDLKHVEEVALAALRGLDGVKEDPAPFFLVDSFGDFAVMTTTYYWYDVKNLNLPEMTNIGALALKQAFEKAGISMPYPIQEVRLDKVITGSQE